MKAWPVVVVVGQKGSGKSSLGLALAGLSGADFADLDELVAREASLPTPREAWRALGEAEFRRLEALILRRELEGARTALAGGAEGGPKPGEPGSGAAIPDGGRPRILAAGGGLADNPAALEALAEGARSGRFRLLVLRLPFGLLAERAAASGYPPSLGPEPSPQAFAALAERREGAYLALAGLPGALVLEAAGLSVREAAGRALSLLDLVPADSAPRRQA
ncbi:MAG TPA: shikimate kinase [Spirochaetia bacterium]|nr:shikimate kinase [Spirochaetales bacterium]HRY72902.1 shikimate kinase [Spirochaetia bacterium]